MILQFPPNDARDRPGLVEAGLKIERESFRIIEEEMGEHSFPQDQWRVIRRVIHTTGDFDYARRIRFSPDAVSCGIGALRNRACIYAGTRMIRAGLSPWRLAWHGNDVVCPAESTQSQELAERSGVTRTLAAFRNRASGLDGTVIAVGNAALALLEVIRLIEEEGVRPGLVVPKGCPRGIRAGRRSRKALSAMSVRKQPSITVLGRKGGSSVAVAIIHAS